ncbi:MAG: Flp pilus assembly protein CpaB [Bryobacterales bacterium]
MDKRLLTVVMVAVLVALVITAVFYQITVGRKPSQAEFATKELVVATRELPMGAKITAADVRLIDYPEQAYPAGGFDSIDNVLERSVMQPILINEPVVGGRVTEPGGGVGLTTRIPEGMRAVAVAVNQVSSVSGFILPGSKVDVLLTGQPLSEEGRATTTVIENLEVLSTAHKVEPGADGRPENVPVVNLLVTPEQAELLTLAAVEGRIQLVLRNPNDKEETAAKRDIARADDLFAKGLVKKPLASAGSPRPRPIVAAAPPPPPPVHEIEMIRGNQRSVETIP